MSPWADCLTGNRRGMGFCRWPRHCGSRWRQQDVEAIEKDIELPRDAAYGIERTSIVDRRVRSSCACHVVECLAEIHLGMHRQEPRKPSLADDRPDLADGPGEIEAMGRLDMMTLLRQLLRNCCNGT